MKFDFSKRSCVIGKINLRNEFHGEDRVIAMDIPLAFAITFEELDMVVPCQDVKLSKILFDSKKRLVTHLLSPISVHRKPEHISVTVYDKQLREKDTSLKFEDVTIKDIKVDLEDGEKLTLRCKAQLRPSPDKRERLIDVMGESRNFECFSAQPELFDMGKPTEKLEKASKQTDVEDEPVGKNFRKAAEAAAKKSPKKQAKKK